MKQKRGSSGSVDAIDPCKDLGVFVTVHVSMRFHPFCAMRPMPVSHDVQAKSKAVTSVRRRGTRRIFDEWEKMMDRVTHGKIYQVIYTLFIPYLFLIYS